MTMNESKDPDKIQFAISRVANIWKFTDTYSSRYALSGVKFDFEACEAIATDGRSMMKLKLDCYKDCFDLIVENGTNSIQLDGRTLRKAFEMLKDHELLRLSYCKSTKKFRLLARNRFTGDLCWEMPWSEVEGRYPNANSVMDGVESGAHKELVFHFFRHTLGKFFSYIRKLENVDEMKFKMRFPVDKYGDCNYCIVEFESQEVSAKFLAMGCSNSDMEQINKLYDVGQIDTEATEPEASDEYADPIA